MAKKMTNKEKNARAKKASKKKLAISVKHNLTGIPKKTKLTNLESFLQSVYHDTVSLETTCNHNCDCCMIAMPGLNYCEFVQIVTKLWGEINNQEKLDLITTSVEYFFRNEYEKWGKQSLLKPCMLLDQGTGLCKVYENRPLNCRLYGLWPKEDYERRVDKFEKAYAKFGLKREDLPLNKQCPYVKRIDDETPITTEITDELFKKLDDMDESIGNFSKLQITQKENYRTFHDWLLLKVLGEDWLSKLTAFMLGASKEIMEDQIKINIAVWTKDFMANGIPDITTRL